MTVTDEDVVSIMDSGYVTLEQIDELVDTEADVETPIGRFRIRALTFQEFLETKERAKRVGGVTNDKDIPEWEATKELLTSAIIIPEFDEGDAERLGKLSPKTVATLVDAITDLAGMGDDEEGKPSFSEGSRTG